MMAISDPLAKKLTVDELAANKRTDVDLLRVVFNPDCKHERCSYDIATCAKCLDYSAKIQKETPREISIGVGINLTEEIPNVFEA